MKTILNIALLGISFFCLFSKTVSAEEVALSEEIRIGQKIYERSFGRGCGACHEILSNPQLVELIQAGELGIDSFTDTMINGKNGMPKSMDAIMATKPVQQAGYTEEQAINAVYKFLEAGGKEETATETPPTGDSSPVTPTPSADDAQYNPIF
jgi:mono/diheme cytochrome c family protein